MRRKTLSIDAGPLARQLLADAISTFAEAAYPPGASECAQVARESLLTTAGILRTATARAEISSRQRPMLKQAIRWYFSEVSPQLTEDQVEALLGVLRGSPATDELFLQQAP